MRNIWMVSDTHFNHANILTFLNYDGTPVRPFTSLEEMNETMIEKWNGVVKDGDKVYHLGDVCMGPRTEFSSILRRLKGRKRLVVGNHDDLNNREFLAHFEKVMAWRVFKDHNFLATHVPLHPGSLMSRKCEFNVHGHLHRNVVLKDENPDPRYFSVCVERTEYTPVHIDEVTRRLNISAG